MIEDFKAELSADLLPAVVKQNSQYEHNQVDWSRLLFNLVTALEGSNSQPRPAGKPCTLRSTLGPDSTLFKNNVTRRFFIGPTKSQ